MTATAGTARCLYVLAVVDADRGLSTLEDGLCVEPLGDLAAVCREMDPAELAGLDGDPADPRLAGLARWHDCVISSLSVEGPALPMRLGTVVADRQRLASALGGARDSLHDALDRVRGCGEWTVQVVTDAPPPHDTAADDGSGAAYLVGRSRALNRAEQDRSSTGDVAAALHAALAACAREARLQAPGSGQVLAGAYLVEHAHAASFVRALAASQAELAAVGAHAQASGPLPPYSFTELRVAVRP